MLRSNPSIQSTRTLTVGVSYWTRVSLAGHLKTRPQLRTYTVAQTTVTSGSGLSGKISRRPHIRTYTTAQTSITHSNRWYEKRRMLVGCVSVAAAAFGTLVVSLDKKAGAKASLAEEDTYPERSPSFETSFPEAYKKLQTILGDRITLDEDALEGHGKEMSGYAKPAWPQAVVWPVSTEEVSEIVKVCAEYVIPIIPFTAGTSLEGHTVAPKGGITMNFREMSSVIQYNEKDMDVVVQPGIGWMELNDYLRPHGTFLGVDPAPGACIGGMCGTCCSGTNAVRYGTMKDQVVNLTVVMADGSIVKTGQRARKSSAGYDLARVIVGSEGTLGIVTQATLRVRQIPHHTSVARVNFPSVHEASEAVIKMLQQGIQLGAVELLDEEMVRATNQYMGMELSESPCLLIKFAGSEAHVADDVKEVSKIVAKHTSEPFVWTKTQEETDKLWQARKHCFWAAQSYTPGKSLMATDVAVPISRLAECIDATKKELDASFLFCPIVGHVGDGNFHVVIMFDSNDPRETAEAHKLNEQMVLRAISMEGTCTGEHGIGLGKKKYLEPELGAEAVEMMRILKRALDPQNILNPSKIVDV